MPTPRENFDIAIDGSRDDDERRRAIDWLEAANECGRLTDLVGMEDLEENYRELALAGLGRRQCRHTLRAIVDDGTLREPLAEHAATLLEETPADSGAGP